MAKLWVIKTVGIKKKVRCPVHGKLSLLAFPLVQVDVCFPLKSTGEGDFPKE
jgi:hypothetical protein